MASKLDIFNMSLGHLKEGKLSSLSENREPRRVLDTFWEQARGECLAAGYWNFAIRSVAVDASEDVEPSFGFDYAFVHPTDFVRLVEMADVPMAGRFMRDFREEAGYWYANLTPIYVRYISNDASYGLDMSLWTDHFAKYLSLQLAEYTCAKITGSTSLLDGAQGITARLKRAKAEARSLDAMNESARLMPASSWVTSRSTGMTNERQSF